MGSLRDRMGEDLRMAGYSESTAKIYLTYARLFVKRFGRPAEMIRVIFRAIGSRHFRG